MWISGTARGESESENAVPKHWKDGGEPTFEWLELENIEVGGEDVGKRYQVVTRGLRQ